MTGAFGYLSGRYVDLPQSFIERQGNSFQRILDLRKFTDIVVRKCECKIASGDLL